MIKLKFQKIALWIPFINATIMMMYIYNTIKMNWIGKRFILGLGLSFLAALFSTVLYKIVLLPLNDVWVNIMNLAYIYLLCFSIGIALIQYQKRLGLQ